MTWNDKKQDLGSVYERGFDVRCENRTVPGVYWAPKDSSADRLVLLGHGGTTHKKVDYIEQIALGLVDRNIAAMAIDGPSHGDRAPTTAAELGSNGASVAADPERFAQLWHGGGGTEAIVADWRAALDFVEAEDGPRPTGWWGLSMGTMMGIPVIAADFRIRLAVLGLMGGWGPNGDDLVRLAPDVTCPLRFLVQWDDQIVPRQACLDLFEALGATKKSLHANPGAHEAIPRFETVDSIDYLAQHLA